MTITLSVLDYIFIFIFFLLTLFIGFYVSKKSSENSIEFFLSGRRMPWWLLGISMVATTFSTDTPNLVTDIVRKNGVFGNWVWWAFLITGLLTVFIYARLWRRSELTTDIEFYELRYSGKKAKFLRVFRAFYLGFIFNILAMSAVTLAAIKISQIMGLDPIMIVCITGVVTIAFSSVSGLKGIIYTDFLLFFVAMLGSIAASIYLINLPEVGGLVKLFKYPEVVEKISFLSFIENKENVIMIFIIPLALQWWSSWYPGAEPGGGGYIAQRMLAAKNENHAIAATFFFNIMHYAIRPWPWILIALASLVIFPDMESIRETFSNITEDKLGDDLAYPAMLTKLPNGLLGITLASLIAAYISTISTHLNWGSSYIVNDLYKQHIHQKASEKELVLMGRLSTIILMVLSSLLAFFLTNALQIFNVIIMFGAGTGLLFILRWFWWRINAWSEITAMFCSGVLSILFSFTTIGTYLFGTADSMGILPKWTQFPFIVLINTILWLLVTYLTKAEKKETLYNFYMKIQPGGIGWRKIVKKAEKEKIELKKEKTNHMAYKILAIALGCIMIYSILFCIGYFLYKDYAISILLLSIALVTGISLVKIWKKIKINTL